MNLHKFFRGGGGGGGVGGGSDHFVIRHYCTNFEHIRVNNEDLVLLLTTLKDICVFGNS